MPDPAPAADDRPAPQLPAGKEPETGASGRASRVGRPRRTARAVRAQTGHRLRHLRRGAEATPAHAPSRAVVEQNPAAVEDAPTGVGHEPAATEDLSVASVATGDEVSAGAAPDPALGPDQPRTADTASTRAPRDNPRGRLWTTFWRPGRGQLIAAFILFIVGMGAVMQVRINTADDTYTTARREDLVQLLDGLGSESRRLEGEIAQLEQTRTSLQSGANTQRVARSEAEKRVQVLSILAGTAPAEGPGIRMRIADPHGKVDADVLLNAVEEMRDAGAEVIEVNNSIRVVASTWFASTAKGLVVDGTPVTSPITIEVIGDPHSLQEAANFRGGLVSEITGAPINGQVQIEQLDRVVVSSLHSLGQTQYAQPASPPPTPR